VITFRPQSKLDKQAAIVLISKVQLLKGKINPQIKNRVSSLYRGGQFSGENGEIFPLDNKGKIILLAGVGDEGASLTALRATVRKALLSTFLKKVKDVEIITHEQGDDVVQAVIEAALIGTYSWKKYLNQDKSDKTVEQKDIWITAKEKKNLSDAITICEGVNFSRNLINDNADIVTSSFIEAAIRDLTGKNKKISLEVLGRDEMANKGLNLHLAVNQGSPNDPKLIIVKYQGAPRGEKYTALIGKGITFDTGGLNLKPTGYIETMRTDMSGAAAVMGTLKNILALDIKKNIIFAVAVAENVIGSRAFKPGDVFRGYSGKTVEIGNTDAEGRLVLADAISYVVKNYKPEKIVDIATLTGACVVALGHEYSGLMSNDDDFAKKLLVSAQKTDDRAWQLPIFPELKDHIKSQVADIKNTGAKGAAGALSAGEFLRQFTDDTKWAHLDIAGTAFVQEAGRLYYGHGATGAGVRLLTDFIKNS